MKPVQINGKRIRTLAQRLQDDLKLSEEQRARIECILVRDHLEGTFRFDNFDGEELRTCDDVIYSIADLAELYHRAFDTGSASGWGPRVRAGIQGVQDPASATEPVIVPHLLRGSGVYVPAAVERKYRPQIVGPLGKSAEGLHQVLLGGTLCVGASDCAELLGISRQRVQLLRQEEQISGIRVTTAQGIIYKYPFRAVLDRRAQLQSYLVDHVLGLHR